MNITSTEANVTQLPPGEAATGTVPTAEAIAQYVDPACDIDTIAQPLPRTLRTILPPACARVAARRGRWRPVPAPARRRGVSWLVRVVALLAALVTLTGCSVSATRTPDGVWSMTIDGRERTLYEAAPAPADARPLDQIALERSRGDARAAHEALLAATDAVWALLAQLRAAAAVVDAQGAVLRNGAAAQREAGQ